MSVLTEIIESWRSPSRVVRRHLARGRSEAFVFTFLILFLFLCFVAQWPAAARVTALSPDIPTVAQLLPRALGLLATIPLWYGLAALGVVAGRALGGQGDWYAGRLALFWALATVSPLVLLAGLVAGLIGPGPQLIAVGVLTFAAFVGFWGLNLRATEVRDAV